MNHTSVILRASLYALACMFSTYSKEFKDVGAAKLMDFKWADWAVLNCDALSMVAITMVAYFDRSFGNHMMNGASKPTLTPEQFQEAIKDWKLTQPQPTSKNEPNTV